VWWKELKNRPLMITEVIRTAIALGVIGASKGLRRRRAVQGQHRAIAAEDCGNLIVENVKRD
jgi:hypothetical protein